MLEVDNDPTNNRTHRTGCAEVSLSGFGNEAYCCADIKDREAFRTESVRSKSTAKLRVVNCPASLTGSVIATSKSMTGATCSSKVNSPVQGPSQVAGGTGCFALFVGHIYISSFRTFKKANTHTHTAENTRPHRRPQIAYPPPNCSSTPAAARTKHTHEPRQNRSAKGWVSWFGKKRGHPAAIAPPTQPAVRIPWCCCVARCCTFSA